MGSFYIEGEIKMKNKVIEVKQVEKSYKDVHVLNGIDFDVYEGEIFALLGSNGAGKTTAIKIMSTLQQKDHGSVKICGFDIDKGAMQIKGKISLTGQFAAVDEILTGRENLIMIARLRHLKNPKKIADEALDRFHLLDAKDRRVSTYSGGMRRKLDIAMSLIGNPNIIFLDEPTTGLDPQARLDVWKEIKSLAQQNTTIFLTTQYLDEAEQLADRIAILNEGKIVMCETLAELKKRFPPAKMEYVVKQPTLEEIFLSIVKEEA